MGRHYLDEADASDPHKLPTLVVDYYSPDEVANLPPDDDGDPMPSGYYYSFGLPGCLNDTEPCGPYDSEEEAVADARDTYLGD